MNPRFQTPSPECATPTCAPLPVAQRIVPRCAFGLAHRGAVPAALRIGAGVVLFCLLGTAQAAPPACAIKPDTLAQAFGVAFEDGKPESGLGTGCVYRTKGGSKVADTDFSVYLGIVQLQGPAPAMRKLMGGPGHEYIPVSADADKAVWVKHGGSVSPFPSVSYERGGYLVNLHVSGLSYEADAGKRDRRLEQVNAKLLKLPRLP